ncbi:MAG: hypothetical protein E7398_00105 [Ruminococcaceae bacterium]|nr:hypothetical protein [Oscillospiraceae bacterium]
MDNFINSLFYRKSSVPCLGCSDRTESCHCTCKHYADWVKKSKDTTNKIHKEKTMQNLIEQAKTQRAIKKKLGGKLYER